MDIRLEKQLESEFPFLEKRSKQSANRITNLYDAFGMEIGDGWYELVREMCLEIMNVYEAAGIPCDIVMLQVKEKYGTLRWYYGHENSDREIQTKVADIVRRYEERSAYVCEECGKPGILRNDLSWILTLCDNHYRKRFDR